MKKKSVLVISGVLLFSLMTFFSGCNQSKEWELNVSFQMNEREGYPRSDQLVIWMENTDGTFIKTLYVSDYLSYGGYNHPEICPDWAVKAKWLEASQEEFDAVTGATPMIGAVSMDFTLLKELVPKGNYNIFIEIHLTEDYNEIYSGELKLSGKTFNNQLNISYNPEKYEKASYEVLSDVQVSIID